VRIPDTRLARKQLDEPHQLTQAISAELPNFVARRCPRLMGAPHTRR
jgi:hypothetical protein